MPILLLDDQSFKLQAMSPPFVPHSFPSFTHPSSPPPPPFRRCNIPAFPGTSAFFGNCGDEDPSPNPVISRGPAVTLGGVSDGLGALELEAGVGDMEQWAASDQLNASPVLRSGEFLWGATHEAQLWSPTGSVVGSPTVPEGMQALQRFLPSNEENEEEKAAAKTFDLYSGEEFRMFEFKVRRCMRGRSHDWTECPFAHPGEKARRRDPRRFHYAGNPCPDFRKGNCKRGDACEFAHGVFECWLHPSRYRTQPCKDGRNCKRRVCFFAHSPDQLRLLPAPNRPSPSDESKLFPEIIDPDHRFLSPLNNPSSFPPPFLNPFALHPSSLHLQLPPDELSSPSLSPPLSPSISSPGSPLAKSLSSLTSPIPLSPLALNCKLSQLHAQSGIQSGLQSGLQEGILAHRRHWDRFNPSLSVSLPPDQRRSHSSLPSPTSPSVQPSSNQKAGLMAQLKQLELTGDESYCFAPAATMAQPRFSSGPSLLRRSSQSVPGTPTKLGWQGTDVDLWHLNEREAEPTLERVESGRSLRAKIFESLLKGKQDTNNVPDVDWVNELVEEGLSQSKEMP